MARCADCAYLADRPELDGKFKCTNSRAALDYVPANQDSSRCNYFCNAFYSRLTTSDRDKKAEISRKAGWYIMTAITKILNLPEDNIYLQTFKVLREKVLDVNETYSNFISDYDMFGPGLAEKMVMDEEAIEYSTYLVDVYLNDFVELVHGGFINDGMMVYIRMYNEIKNHYLTPELTKKCYKKEDSDKKLTRTR